MLVVREIRIHDGANCAVNGVHTWREDTTNINQGAAGGSSLLLSLCYVGTPTMATQLVYRTHLKGKGGKKKQEREKRKRFM